MVEMSMKVVACCLGVVASGALAGFFKIAGFLSGVVLISYLVST